MMTDSYFTSSTNAQIVGEAVGKLLAELYKNGLRNYHLTGHSLGAHASGFAGKVFQNITGIKLNRISGLDPAGPCFFYEPANLRLTSTDADFVDVIHTNMGVFGIPTSIGHVDFFPHGGSIAAGCWFSVCSHLIVGFYYAESVTNNNFLGVQCSDWNTFRSGVCVNNARAIMGYWTPTDTRGNYYLDVNMFPLFAKGESGLRE
ncbi:lipase member I-like isoform X2 [Arctopsyche grandis]